MSINTRIKELRKHLRLTQIEFSKKIGCSQSFLAGVEREKSSLSDPWIATICYTFTVNESWLRTGKGHMFSAPSSNTFEDAYPDSDIGVAMASILTTYNRLDDAGRRPIRAMLNGIAEIIQNADQDNRGLIIEDKPADVPAPLQLVPLVAQTYVLGDIEEEEEIEMARVLKIGRVAAGIPIEAIQDNDDFFDVPADWRADYVLEIVGDSMEPDFPDGSHIAVRENHEPSVGALVVAQLYSPDDENAIDATFKRLRYINGTVVLEAINEEYEDITWPRKFTSFLGVVMGIVE